MPKGRESVNLAESSSNVLVQISSKHPIRLLSGRLRSRKQTSARNGPVDPFQKFRASCTHFRLGANCGPI